MFRTGHIHCLPAGRRLYDVAGLREQAPRAVVASANGWCRAGLAAAGLTPVAGTGGSGSATGVTGQRPFSHRQFDAPPASWPPGSVFLLCRFGGGVTGRRLFAPSLS